MLGTAPTGVIAALASIESGAAPPPTEAGPLPPPLAAFAALRPFRPAQLALGFLPPPVPLPDSALSPAPAPPVLGSGGREASSAVRRRSSEGGTSCGGGGNGTAGADDRPGAALAPIRLVQLCLTFLPAPVASPSPPPPP
eukprot:CAMPEP_0115235208 /NCGR_PEP_ID=MMETSP0270-20121206/35189_1 /TAXON_ID=71861 /ORGANISM="Scrippsiella trochoidea, Strain CCMP3099" /LENGTH=139 /DNA_ID=CAMNT_0002649977 /DNA_START=99 /DNA_END=514 /DNA_ORIENTATION=-